MLTSAYKKYVWKAEWKYNMYKITKMSGQAMLTSHLKPKTITLIHVEQAMLSSTKNYAFWYNVEKHLIPIYSFAESLITEHFSLPRKLRPQF